MQQCKYRNAPKPSPAIAAECIREGRLYPGSDLIPEAGPEYVVFEHERAGATWRVVAAIKAKPYTDADATHPLITIYAVNAHGPGFHDSAFAEG